MAAASSGVEEPPRRGVLFEWRAVGASIRLVAIDPATGLEVVVVGPASAGIPALKALASRKLERRLGAARLPLP